MPCKVDPPTVTKLEWLEHMLCKACQHLSAKQMIDIKGLDIYQDLTNWYISHLLTDAHYFNFEYLKKEPETNYHLQEFAEHIHSFHKDKIERASKEIKRIENELKKFNCRLIITGPGIGIEKLP